MVAIFLGVSKYNKWSLNGKVYDFLAIPSGLAEKLVSGIWFVEEGVDRNVDRMLRMLDRRLDKIREGGRKYAVWLKDPDTASDIKRQLHHISFGCM